MKDDRVYLLHVRDAINRILEYTADGEEIRKVLHEESKEDNGPPGAS